MNKVLMIALLLLSFAGTKAQTPSNPYPKTISVTGSAEMEIVPDEIYVTIDLKEYDKKGQGKISIDKIRQDFLSAVRLIGIPDSSISIAAYDGYSGNPWLRKKNKKNELYSSITYQVKLRSAAQVDQLVDKLDDAATQNFYISKTSHSKLEEFKKQLKIQAVKAAKEKAGYLAAAINEKIGDAITINEPTEYFQPYYNVMSNARMKNMELSPSTNDQPQADFKKIKLKYDVSVVFALR